MRPLSDQYSDGVSLSILKLDLNANIGTKNIDTIYIIVSSYKFSRNIFVKIISYPISYKFKWNLLATSR